MALKSGKTATEWVDEEEGGRRHSACRTGMRESGQ